MQSAAALPLPVAVPHRPLRQPNAIHWRIIPQPLHMADIPATGGIIPQYDLSACGFIQQLEESDDALPYRRQSYAQTRRETFELSTFAHRASLGTKPQGSVES